MNKANKYADIEKMSFEKAMAELETIVSDLENGSIELEDHGGQPGRVSTFYFSWKVLREDGFWVAAR